MKSTGLAYLLLICGGGLGLHKFYLGRPGMGVLYLCTGGIFGLGWLYDLFTLPRQVREANVRMGYGMEEEPELVVHHYYHEAPPSPLDFASMGGTASMAGASPEKQILILSRRFPVMSVRDAVAGTRLEIHEAETALHNLAEEGLAREIVDEDGRLSYDFGN
jgi:hypothetical protein